VKETTIDNKSVYVIDNSKKMKQCPKDQCHCPCACKRGGGDKGGSGGDKGGSSGQKDQKGGHRDDHGDRGKGGKSGH